MTKRHSSAPPAKKTVASQEAVALGQRLVRLREAREWNRAQAAREIQIAYARLQKYEEGKREPPLWALIRMADGYSVSISFLVAGRQDEPKIVKFPPHTGRR